MPEQFKIKLVIGLFIALFTLPLAIWLLGRGHPARKKRVFQWIAGFFLLIDLSAFAILLLLHIDVLEMEWRGGYVPIVTMSKTKPNFDALERSRLDQRQLAHPTQSVANTNKPASASSDWPQFRGVGIDGLYSNSPIQTQWPTNGLKLLWRQACGGGYSSFAIADGRAFTLEQRRDFEVLVAYDLETGRELWTNGWAAKFSEYHSDEGPRTTPSYSEGMVYSLGATGEFLCVNAASGKTIWGTNIVTQNKASLPDYGLAASPLVIGDKIILQPDAYHGFSVVAYDKNDGHILWHALDLPMGYATPMPFRVGNEDQVIVCARPFIVGLRLSDGAERWRYNWHVNNNERPIVQPLLIDSNAFFLSAAYMTGCAKVEVTANNGEFITKEVFRNKSLKSKFSSPVLYQGYIYGLDEEILACVDAKTGERKWKDGRYGYGQIMLASGHLIVQCANGDLALIKAIPDQLTEVARFPAIAGKSWNEPAISGGRLLLRNSAQMACFDISSK